MHKIILTDCDGVLCNWDWAFRTWMVFRGHELSSNARLSYQLSDHYDKSDPAEILKCLQEFNKSESIGFLPAFRDSVYYVTKLHKEHGYKFRVITSLGTDKRASKLRELNLKKLFGSAIDTVTCLDTDAPKDTELSAYQGTGMWWIEDKYENFKVGNELGLKSILVEHGFNMHEDTAGGFKASTWKEIYEIITAAS